MSPPQMRSEVTDKPVIQQARRAQRGSASHAAHLSDPRPGIEAGHDPRPAHAVAHHNPASAFARDDDLGESRRPRATAKLRHVLVAIKCTYPNKGARNG